MTTSEARKKALETRRYARHVQKALAELRDVYPEHALAIDEAIRHTRTLLEWLDEVVELFDEPKEEDDADA